MTPRETTFRKNPNSLCTGLPARRRSTLGLLAPGSGMGPQQLHPHVQAWGEASTMQEECPHPHPKPQRPCPWMAAPAPTAARPSLRTAKPGGGCIPGTAPRPWPRGTEQGVVPLGPLSQLRPCYPLPPPTPPRAPTNDQARTAASGASRLAKWPGTGRCGDGGVQADKRRIRV